MEAPSSCFTCGVEKANVEGLRHHITREHLKWLPFECPLCNKRRPTQAAVEEHIHANHPQSDLKFLKSPDPAKESQLEELLKLSRQHQPLWNRRGPPPQYYPMLPFYYPPPPVVYAAAPMKTPPEETVECRLCHQLLRPHLVRKHVLRSHVRKKLYQCSNCDYSSKDDRIKVVSHLEHEHPDIMQRSIIDRADEFENDIKRAMHNCFPTVP